MGQTATEFSAESFAFLAELAENNNRDWYQDNKARFTAHLEAPFVALLDALSGRLSDAAIPLSGSKKTMFRMNRDVRFSHNKQPYKTNVGGMLTRWGVKNEGAGLVYLHLAVEDSFVAAGFYNLSAKQLVPIRDAMIERAEAFDAVLASLTKAGRALADYGGLSSMPRGYAQYSGHRHAEHIKRTSLLINQPLSQDDWTSGAVFDLADQLARDSMGLLDFERPAQSAQARPGT